MRRGIHYGPFIVLAALPGCLITSAPPKKTLSPEQRARIVKMGGEQLLTDVDRVSGRYPADRSAYWADQCVTSYVLGLASQERGEPQKARAQLQSCARWCAHMATEAKSAPDLSDIGARYTPRCEAARDVLDGAAHLERAAQAERELEAAMGAYDRLMAMARLRGAIDQASEAIGADDPKAAEWARRRDDLAQKYRDDLEKAKRFLADPEVKALEGKLGDLKAEIADLERSGGYPELLRRKQDERDALEKEWTYLAKKWGVL
jgi:hypothetical protein